MDVVFTLLIAATIGVGVCFMVIIGIAAIFGKK